MSAPRPYEIDLLAHAEYALKTAADSLNSNPFEARLQILEACAARFGGFSLGDFHKSFGVQSIDQQDQLLELATSVTSAIERCPMHPALALSALARETLDEAGRKNTGAYHTDFRLAERLAQLAPAELTHKGTAIDPACGAGILLVALTIAVCGRDRTKIAHWLANGVYAADLSENSLRAALLSLASMTDDLNALITMRSHWRCGDSLLMDSGTWSELSPDGFDVVVGNPPWEKVKLSRHEFLKSTGNDRHYGAEMNDLDEAQFKVKRDVVADYSKLLAKRFPDLATGEPDLYIAFTALFFTLCKPGGTVAALVPGGLIRSQGTESVRRRLFDASSSVSISIIDNKARFFSIDTRFKFLALGLVKASSGKVRRDPIVLMHQRGTASGIETFGLATLGRSNLVDMRPDLTIPEVRNQAEWKVFQKVAANATTWNSCEQTEWSPQFCREVDMTKERPRFLPAPHPDAVPLVEGRMVQQHRFGVKGYSYGSGRKAIWEPHPIGASKLKPQFWIDRKHVPPGNRGRLDLYRAGFCDIAGQTNERSLMAALIPPGVACGNKVPTVLFPGDPSRDRLLVWLAIVNSFTFDWLLRRVLTTTVNYFLLQSIPLPKLTKEGLPWKKLVACAQELIGLDNSGATKLSRIRMAQLRSEMEAEVAVAYGLDPHDLQLMLDDFPLLDRGQPRLPGEDRSTITRDMTLAALDKRIGARKSSWKSRVAEASALGAEAFIPSEVSSTIQNLEEESGEMIHG